MTYLEIMIIAFVVNAIHIKVTGQPWMIEVS